MDLHGLPKTSSIKKAIMVNTTHNDGLQKELRCLEDERRGAMATLRVNKRKFIERRKKLPLIHQLQRKKMDAEASIWSSTDPNAGNNGAMQSVSTERPGSETNSMKSPSRLADSWSFFSRDLHSSLSVAETGSRPCSRSSTIECINLAQQGVTMPAAQRSARQPSTPSQMLEMIKMNELRSLVEKTRARANLDVPPLGGEILSRSLPSSPRMVRKRYGSSDDGQLSVEYCVTPPKSVSIVRIAKGLLLCWLWFFVCNPPLTPLKRTD